MKFKVLLYLCLLGPIKLGFSVEILADQNSSVTLPCFFTLPANVNVSLLEVSWSRNGSVIASQNNTEKGFHLDTSDFVNGSFALKVDNATVDKQGDYECRVTFNTTDFSSNVTLTIKARPSLSIPSLDVVLGKESEVECRAEGFSPPKIAFSWTRANEELRPPQWVTAVIRMENGLFVAVNRLTFVPEPVDRNKTFGCVVQHISLNEPLIKEFQPRISILPSVSVSIIPSSSRSSPLTLSCDINGYYPERVSVDWYKNNSKLPESYQTEQNQDGTFKTRRFYTLGEKERKEAGVVQCVVRLPNVTDSAVGSIDLTAADSSVTGPALTKSAKASVAMMIISLVLVILLCFGFSWRNRDEKQKSLNVSRIILPPKVIVGQKGRVTLSVEGRRADMVQVAWFLNDIPIIDTSYAGAYAPVIPQGHTPRISVVSEKGPLLPPTAPGYYKMHTQPALHSTSGIKQVLSSFTFIPNLAVHKGAVFKCQISYKGKDKLVAERVSEKFTLLAAPEVSEIQLSEPNEETGIVTLTAKASHFHPDIITFRWFCEGGELSPVSVPPALAAPQPDSEGFFSAMSQCKLPRAELERGEARVWVTIHHISLKQPITRETRGFIKKPTVSDITCSPSSTSQVPLTLGCDITGFYPPDISVTWLKHKEIEGNSDQEKSEEIKEEVAVWGPLLTHTRTFRATAVLQGVEKLVEEMQNGGKIVCRVEHCSLQEPVERVWKNVLMVAPSIPPNLSVYWDSEGVGVFSLLLSGGNPQPEVLWAAGGSTLTQLQSKEKEQMTDEGKRELRSVCALKKISGRQSQGGVTHNRRNGDVHKIQASDVKCETEEETVDERADEEKTNPQCPEVREDVVENKEKESGDEKERGNIPSYVNTVRMRREGRECLRVTVEITHPALSMPVYRTWTEPTGEVST